jgi:hypothetical protein
VKSSTRPWSKNSSFPEGFLDCDVGFTRRVQVLMRYVFSEEHQKLKPFDIEDSKGLGHLIKESGLATLLKKASIFDLLQIAYPMYMAGDFPIIRPHLIKAKSKWELDPDDHGFSDFMIMSAKRIALEQNIIKADVTYDLEKIKTVNWSEVFNDQGYRAVFNLNVDNLRGPLDALTMALPGIIGIKQGQIRPWDLEGIKINWSQTNAKGERINSINYIKLLTQAIVRDAGCVSDSNDVDISKIKQIKNWRERFDKEFSGALSNSGYSVYEAFELTYPHLCGLTKNKIRKSDFKTSWKENNGKLRFQIQFAEALYEFLECLKGKQLIDNHQARLNTKGEPSKNIIKISKKDMHKIKTFLLNKKIHWDMWFSFKGLSGALKAVAGGKIHKAFQLLFGKPNKSTGCYGKTDIKPDWVLYTDSAYAESSVDATKTLESGLDNSLLLDRSAYWKSEFRNFDLLKTELFKYHKQIRQGVTPDNLLKQLCSILEYCDDLDSKSYLEFLLEQKDSSGKYAFGEKALGVLLNMIDKVLLGKTALQRPTTLSVKSFINDLESWRHNSRSFRSIILDAVKYDRESLKRVTPIGVLNEIIGNLYKLSNITK